uniref:Transmembrane protein n=1 Tax=Peronospora matthiolae TaxID=2874970 RepID=A0AAV1UDJ1_9STRA
MPSIKLDPAQSKLQQQQIPISATMATSRQGSRTFVDVLDVVGHALRVLTSHVRSKVAASGVVTPSIPRSLCVGILVLLLVLSSLGRLELWMACAGLVMVALSVVSAIHELKLSKIVPSSYQDLLEHHKMEPCSHLVLLPQLAPSVKNRVALRPPSSKDVMATTTTLNIATSASSCSPATVVQEETDRRDCRGPLKTVAIHSSAELSSAAVGSCNSTPDGHNKLDVLHCGTVIDIQGAHGFIIPHDIGVDANAVDKSPVQSRSVSGCDFRPGKQHKMPFVIPFKLNEEQTAARQDIAVGKTVEFAYSQVAAAATSSPALVCARNVTPVCTDDGIRKSRSALQSCKQAREVSFARAMEELTMISLRHVPVKHHVDLIKYAEKLDDQGETRLSQWI